MAPVIWGGGPPLDGGRLFFDGKRLLGKAKTIRGTYVGILAGTIVGLLQHIVYPFPSLGYALLRGFLLGAGAIGGDIVGSFIKRRFNIESGDAAPLGLPPLEIILMSILITPFVHLISNAVWYLAGKKEVWW
jgi:CDP-2,3-bis-(O-geranylgeranyl)-sn-glycerol synthase